MHGVLRDKRNQKKLMYSMLLLENEVSADINQQIVLLFRTDANEQSISFETGRRLHLALSFIQGGA